MDVGYVAELSLFCNYVSEKQGPAAAEPLQALRQLDLLINGSFQGEKKSDLLWQALLHGFWCLLPVEGFRKPFLPLSCFGAGLHAAELGDWMGKTS